jgi:hypothetical protein
MVDGWLQQRRATTTVKNENPRGRLRKKSRQPSAEQSDVDVTADSSADSMKQARFHARVCFSLPRPLFPFLLPFSFLKNTFTMPCQHFTTRKNNILFCFDTICLEALLLWFQWLADTVLFPYRNE